MKKNKISLLSPVLWFAATGIWSVTFCTNLYYHAQPNWAVILQGVTVLISLAAAIVNLIRYNKTKNDPDM